MPKHGFSIITCTNRPPFIHNIFRHYKNQIGVNKELIIVLNHNSMSVKRYRAYAKRFPNVRVYQLPQLRGSFQEELSVFGKVYSSTSGFPIVPSAKTAALFGDAKKKGIRVYSGAKLLSQPHRCIAYTRHFRKWVNGR